MFCASCREGLGGKGCTVCAQVGTRRYQNPAGFGHYPQLSPGEMGWMKHRCLIALQSLSSPVQTWFQQRVVMRKVKMARTNTSWASNKMCAVRWGGFGLFCPSNTSLCFCPLCVWGSVFHPTSVLQSPPMEQHLPGSPSNPSSIRILPSSLLLHCLQWDKALPGRGHVFSFPPLLPISSPSPPLPSHQPFLSSFPPQPHHLPQPAPVESRLAPIVLSLGPKLKFMTS